MAQEELAVQEEPVVPAEKMNMVALAVQVAMEGPEALVVSEGMVYMRQILLYMMAM